MCVPTHNLETCDGAMRYGFVISRCGAVGTAEKSRTVNIPRLF